MTEQRFLRNPKSAAALRLALNSNETRIKINWEEAAAKAIEIRHHFIEAAKQARFNYLKSVWRSGRASRLTLTAPEPMNFAARQRRWER